MKSFKRIVMKIVEDRCTILHKLDSRFGPNQEGLSLFSRVPVGTDVIQIPARFGKEISNIFTTNLIEILWKYLGCIVQKFEKEKK